jgi:hypothetical protein
MKNLLLSATALLFLTFAAVAQGGMYGVFDNTAGTGNPGSVSIYGDNSDGITITVGSEDDSYLFIGIFLSWKWDADLEVWYTTAFLDTWINGVRPDDPLALADITIDPATGDITVDFDTTPEGLTVPGGGNYGMAGTRL